MPISCLDNGVHLTASASATVAEWNNISDIDSKIENDLGDVENQCDELSQDSNPVSDASTYESAVKSDQVDINNLMDQRKSIITTLSNNKQL